MRSAGKERDLMQAVPLTFVYNPVFCTGVLPVLAYDTSDDAFVLTRDRSSDLPCFAVFFRKTAVCHCIIQLAGTACAVRHEP